MGDFDATVIVGNLDGKELLSSIDKLVQDVSVKTNKMAEGFTQGIDRMKLAMKDFAITQKVSVDLMQEAWRKMSSSFDAMVAAQSNATGSGRRASNNGGGASFPDNTVGNLKEVIALEEKRRLDMELGTQELRDQNKLIADQKQQLKEELMTEEEKHKAIQKQNEALVKQKVKQRKDAQKPYVTDFNKAASMTDEGLTNAQRKLKEMVRTMDAMRKSGLFNETELNSYQRKLDALKRKIANIKPSKPLTLKEVLGMDENGIDAITAKLKALRGIQVAPNSNDATLLANEYQRLKKAQGDLLGQNAKLIGSNNYLAQSFGYIRNRIVYALTLGAITNFTKQIYEIRGQYELLERSLGVLTNSFQKGSQIFQELNDMAIKSPFTLMELATAAKQLTAYNFAADEVVDTTRRLADISAALGVPMERLTYNLGQIRAQTVLTARDARDFANAGLPMVKALADYYTELEGRVVSTGDVYDRMSKKAVAYADVMAVLNKMTDEGGKFFDFQAKQAETLKVQMNNLTLAWNNMLNEMGKDNQSILELPLKGLRTIFENWESLNQVLTNLIIILGTAKVAQLALNMALGKGNVEQLRSIALNTKATEKNYKNALSKMQITKEQAKLMIATNRGNATLHQAIISMGLLTEAEVKAAASTNALRNSWTILSNMFVIGVKKIGASMMALATNPATWVFAATYAITDFLSSLNEVYEKTKEFNDIIGKNIKENTDSIGKFFSDYAKSFEKLRDGKMEQTEQVKLWEAIREEIKKSSQNAEEYLAYLEKFDDINERNKKGGTVLATIKRLQESVYAAQENGLINTEGTETYWHGILWEGLADNIKGAVGEINDALKSSENDFEGFANKYQKMLDVINNPDNYNNVVQRGLNYFGIANWEFELSREIEKFNINFDTFSNSIADSMEKMWNPNVEKSTRNIREYVNTIVKAYKEAHPEIKGQAERFFDINVDKFVAKQVRTFATVKDKNDEFLQETYSAWRIFYDKLRNEGGQDFEGLMQYVTKTGDYSNKELEKIWKQASETMKREAGDAYATIDKYIADLNTRKIVVPVLYQQKQIEGDNLQKDFEKHFINDGLGALPYDKYQKELLRRTRLYKNLNKKEGEETLQWNKRLNDLYNDDLANIKKQDEIMGKITDKESVRYKQAKETKEYYTQQINAVKEVAKYEGFTLEEKKKNKGRNKDEILDALKKEIELIKKAQSEYETLTKKGSSSTDALASAQSKFGKTLTLLNNKLSHWGLPTIDLSKIIKGDPNKTLAFFEKVKKALETKGLSNIERMKAVEVVIDEFDLKAKTFNLDNITKGLNDALSKLKEKYELSVELDANPKLGKFFADMLGLDIDTLPRTINAYEKEYTRLLNNFFKAKNVNLELPHLDLTNDDLKAFEEMKKEGAISEEAYNEINKAVKEFRDTKKKDFEETRKEYEALIKKYGEYEAKIEEVRNTSDKERLAFAKKFGKADDTDKAIRLITDIQAVDDPAKKAELRQQLASLVQEIAQGDDTKIRLQTSIDMKGLQEEARINFEEYQKTPEWVLATGNISDLTHNALSKLIADLEQYKKKAKYLDDKQIKKINNALIALHKQIRKDNPFLAMGDSMDEARERMSLFQPELDTIMKQIIDLEKEIGDGEGTDKQLKKLADLKKRWGEVYDQQQAYGKVAATTIVKNINNAISVAKQASSAFNEMAEALGGKGMTEAAQTIQDVTGILEKGGQGAAIGAQAGGGYGAIIGAAAGVLQGVVTTFADRWSGNAKITEKIVESQREVKKLTLLYKQLENAIDDAYGQGEIRANQLLIANKKLQLAELETQLELEKSRKSKNRDDDKILELQGQVEDARQELKELANDITENFLNISSVKDAVSSMIDGIITALKNGENAMDSFTDSWEEMCWNMIKQVISTEILAPKFKKIFDEINEEVSKRGEKASDDIVKAKEDYENNKEYVQKWSDWYVRKGDEFKRAMNYYDLQDLRKKGWVDSSFSEWDAAQQKHIKDLEDAYTEATSWTLDDVERYAELLKSMQGDYEAAEEATREAAERLGLRMGDKAGNLSALQAGIQGITEDTAGAIEAYLNIVSQRMFYHGTILEQIRDTLVGFDLDLSLGVQSQMLLQLQNSYQTQMAIQNLLEGTLTPNGRAFMVELNS